MAEYDKYILEQGDSFNIFKIEDNSHTCSASINRDMLESVEEYLCATRKHNVESLVEYRKFKSSQPRQRSEDEFGWMEKFKLQNLEKTRDEFYINLDRAYRIGTNIPDFDNLAIITGKLMCDKKIINTSRFEKSAKTARDLMTNIKEALRKFEENLKNNYLDLWKQVPSNVIIDNSIESLNMENIKVLNELGQLTSFYKTFYNLAWRDIRELKFDAITLSMHIPKTVLQGDLGMGKTTLMKRICYVLASETKKGNSNYIPIFSLLANAEGDKSTNIRDVLLSSSKNHFRSLESLSVHDIFWILDGFDEVASMQLRENTLDWINSRSGPERVILSSRPAALPPYINGMTRLRLIPFTSEQISQFITKVKWDDAEKPRKLIDIINTTPDLCKIAQTPLLLTLLVILAKTQGPWNLPKRRESVYRVIINHLLGEWDTAKGVKRLHAIKEIEDRLAILQRLSLILYENKKITFSKTEVMDILIKDIPPIRPIDQDIAYAYIDNLIMNCIFVPTSKDNIRYFHLSFQEYLAAEALNRDITPQRIFKALHEYFSSGRWEETLVFYAGIKRDMAPIINDLHLHLIAKWGNTEQERLASLLNRWFEVADFTEIDKLNPRGSVAKTLEQLNVGGRSDRWKKLAGLPLQ